MFMLIESNNIPQRNSVGSELAVHTNLGLRSSIVIIITTYLAVKDVQYFAGNRRKERKKLCFIERNEM